MIRDIRMEFTVECDQCGKCGYILSKDMNDFYISSKGIIISISDWLIKVSPGGSLVLGQCFCDKCMLGKLEFRRKLLRW